MTYLIDAWLDRPQPYLRILNRNTGEVCALLKELVRNLFLYCYARALRP